MDTVLVLVTCISAAAAAGMGGMLFFILRKERRRSEARVMALVEMASTEPWEPASDPTPGATDWTGRSPDTIVTAGFEFRAPDDTPELAASDSRRPMFAGSDTASPWGPRAAAAAVLALLVLILAGGASLSRGGDSANAAAPAVGSPLDLLSLSHDTPEEGLRISGVVQNPHDSVHLTGISVTAVLLAGDGRVLGSGRAPLDFPSLRPGEESPFVVKVGARGTVARYRIGFRAADGRVVAHVDRRPAVALARTGDVR